MTERRPSPDAPRAVEAAARPGDAPPPMPVAGGGGGEKTCSSPRAGMTRHMAA